MEEGLLDNTKPILSSARPRHETRVELESSLSERIKHVAVDAGNSLETGLESRVSQPDFSDLEETQRREKIEGYESLISKACGSEITTYLHSLAGDYSSEELAMMLDAYVAGLNVTGSVVGRKDNRGLPKDIETIVKGGQTFTGGERTLYLWGVVTRLMGPDTNFEVLSRIITTKESVVQMPSITTQLGGSEPLVHGYLATLGSKIAEYAYRNMDNAKLIGWTNQDKAGGVGAIQAGLKANGINIERR